MLRTFWKFIAVMFCQLQGIHADAQNRPQLTVLYDNYPFSADLAAGEDFSCMLSGIEKTILFDTSANGDDLLSNMKALNIDPRVFDLVVISQEHKDHTNGLLPVLDSNSKAAVYVPAGFWDFSLISQIEARKNKIVLVKQATHLPEASLHR